MFMTLDGIHSIASSLRMRPGACASAVCQRTVLPPSKPNACDRAIERMPRMVPSKAPAMVPE